MEIQTSPNVGYGRKRERRKELKACRVGAPHGEWCSEKVGRTLWVESDGTAKITRSGVEHPCPCLNQ